MNPLAKRFHSLLTLLSGSPPPAAPAVPVATHEVAASGLVQQALDERNMFEAWDRVRENAGAAGVDGQSIDAFGHNVLGRLQQLRSEVLKSQYSPQPLMRIAIPKPDGSERLLAIPAVRDRILQTAVARVLQPTMEAEFEDSSYGYRTGRSVAMAIARVVRWRDSGLRYVVDGDIETFFDKVDHALLMKKLGATIRDRGVQELIALWMAAIVQDGKRSWLLERGVPQGSPLSPMLANLYLDTFDEELLAAGLQLVRYADDFVVFCRSSDAAREALVKVKTSLAGLKLRLNESKTRLVHFDDGFVFLGVRFKGSFVEAVDPEAEPWLLPDERDRKRAAQHEAREAARAAALGADPTAPAPIQVLPKQSTPSEPASSRQLDGDDANAGELEAELAPGVRLVEADGPAEPLLHSLYVGEPGSAVIKEGDRVTVSHAKAVQASVPLGQLDLIVVQAPAMISSAILLACAERRIGVYVSHPGADTPVTIERGTLPDLERLSLQIRRHRHAGFNLLVARALVEGKLQHCKLVLRRFGRSTANSEVGPRLKTIDDCLHKLPAATTLDTLRGLEGAGSRAYFEALRSLLPPECGFPGRRRRPPKDAVNALLSFGYTVLAAQVNTFVRLEGLNPHFGNLHATGPRTQALVSDLMEEFRPVVVDAVVLTVLREGRIGPADFAYDSADEIPCRLTKATRKAFVGALEEKLESRFIHPRLKRVIDYRRAIQSQVRHYSRVLDRREIAYLPLKLK